MGTRVLRQIGWVTASLTLTSMLVGCGNVDDESASDQQVERGAALTTTNGLTNINGLTQTNGLVNTNGLTMTNGLTSTNGLGNTNGLISTNGGRATIAYLVKCALSSGDSITKYD